MERMALKRARFLAIVAGVGGAALLSGCGGGGSGGGVDRPPAGFQLGSVPTVQKLETPLGLTGSRGAGADVFVSFNLKDREYNPASVQLEYGWDVDGDGVIEPSDGDPSATDEFFPCTPASGYETDIAALDTATGKGADHLFVWSSATDLPGARFVTQDYSYTPQGRPIVGSDGEPVFGNTPAIRLRMRANDDEGAKGRWGDWNTTKPFDLNNNSQPSITIDTGGLNGVSPNATGTAADTDVVLNFRIIDADSGLSGGVDYNAVSVDFAPVPPGADLTDPAVVDALDWLPATTAAGTADTGLTSSPAPGTLNTWTWDSRTDVGTVNGDYILRITPFDSKLERGATVMMPGRFRLDNYTIFTDAGAALSAARVGHRATTLADGRVLITGGRTTTAGASVGTAELFYPGTGQTTYGAVAPTASLATPRSYHSQTRLTDDRVMVAGGYDASGAPVSSIEIYNATTGLWTTLGSGLVGARARHTAVLLSNGDVLFAGGVDGSGAALATACVYRAETGTVVATSSGMAAARHSVGGALLPDGKVLIPGGKDTAGSGLSSTELYDPAANTFAAGPAMSSARAEHAVAAATDGTVVVSGGVGLNTLAIYDGRTNTWDNSAPAMPSARAGHVGVLMGDGLILLAGGSDGASVVSSANLYDPSTGSYDAPNSGMVEARRDAATAVLNNGRILILGGLGATGAPIASCEIFTPDGGFNYVPTAVIATPAEPQSWAFGALLSYRLIDTESDPAKVLFQYSISGGAWKTCSPKGGAWDDGLADTIAGDVNEGLVGLATTDADSALPIDPVLKNTVGDHLFIWDMTADIVRADYDSVRARVIPFGAGRGVQATTSPFKIAFNTRVIPRFDAFTSPVSGTVAIDYHLQDIDGVLAAPEGDGARVEFEYGIDVNGDKQILAADGESWATCTAAPGGDGLGAGYTLTTSKTFNPTVGTLGWHTFNWDSVRDIGSPGIGVTRSDVMLRITPYDFPAGVAETKGRQETMGVDQGLQVVLDPNGLYLVSWKTEGNVTHSGTPIPGVKLDETLVFTFNREVDPATVDGTVGQTTLPVTVGGRKILGAYQADPTDYKVVRFFPQVNNSVNGVLTYNGSENPTILTRGASVTVAVPGFTPGMDPETANILRIKGWTAGSAAVDIANLLTFNYAPGFIVSSTAGSGAYFARATAPVVTSSTPVNGSVNQGLTQGFSIVLNLPVSAESVNFSTLRFVVDIDGDGVADANDSIIPGSFSVVNTVGPAGTRQAVITFTPMVGLSYPAGSKVLADLSKVTSGDGVFSQGPGATPAVASFSTVAGATTTNTFSESFTSNTDRKSVV